MAEDNAKIDIEQVVAAYNQNLAELDKARKMIDKMAINEAKHTVEIAERDVIIDTLRDIINNAQDNTVSEEE
jgi:uncharacterized protein|tara:strand:+ start:2274 stop:2489 length:216 start_codon:yes stop_codon:yes gene_type:complete